MMITAAEANSTGIFDLFLGLPLHPLVVHAAVILVPLAALAAIAMAIKPNISREYGVVIIGLTLVGQLSSVIAKLSGEQFQARLGIDIERHASFGEVAPLTSLPLLALVILLYRFDRNRKSGNSRRLVAVLVVASAIFAAGYMALTGHSGAEAVWSWVKFN